MSPRDIAINVSVAGLLLVLVSTTVVRAQPSLHGQPDSSSGSDTSSKALHPRMFRTGLTGDQLTAVINNPLVSTVLFFALWAGLFIFVYFFGLVELATGVGSSRDFDGGSQWNMEPATMLSTLSALQEMWGTFDVTDEHCRKRFACELQTVGPHLGTTARRVVEIMDYLGHVNVSSAPQWLRPTLVELVESTRAATTPKGCSTYDRCKYSFVNQFKLDKPKWTTDELKNHPQN